MEHISAMYDICEASAAYIHLPEERERFAALRDRLREVAVDHYMGLEPLVNAFGSAAALEGFVNGYAWAQTTAKECLDLRESQKGLRIKIDPDLLSAAIEAMRELQIRYEAEAAALATVGDLGRELAQERLESAGVAHGLWNFLTDI